MNYKKVPSIKSQIKEKPSSFKEYWERNLSPEGRKKWEEILSELNRHYTTIE